MKFKIAKKDIIKCKGCSGYVERGDEMVQLYIRNSKDRKMITVLSFHIVCYVPWMTEFFNNKWKIWKSNCLQEVPKKGTPVTYIIPTKKQQLNKLRSSLCYHKKLGHEDRVQLLLTKITKITS